MADYYWDNEKYNQDVKKLKLIQEEKERTKNLLNRLKSGEIESPSDFLDDWKKLEFSRPDEPQEIEECVDTDKIKGASHPERLSKNRLEKVLNILLNDNWIVNQSLEYPHVVKKPDEEVFHVGVDGHHRVMAFKAVGLDRIQVRYEI